jgi:hypothetical protein
VVELGGIKEVSLGSVAWVWGGERRSWCVGVWWWQLAARSSFAQAFGAATTAGTLASWRREHSWHHGSDAVRMRDPCSSAAHRNEQIAFHLVSFIFTYFHL